MSLPVEETWATLVRHPGQMPCAIPGIERLISSEDDGRVAAWAHEVEVCDTPEHYHRRTAELYYVLEGQGHVLLDGQRHAVTKGSIVHIPPGVIHGARGRMRVLVIGVPDLAEEDVYYLEE